MLLWKTTPLWKKTPSAQSETVRRPLHRVRRVPRKITKVSSTSRRDDEKRRIFKLVLAMLLLLVLPAILAFLYLFFA